MNTPDDEPSAEEEAELSDEELISKFMAFRDRLDEAMQDGEEMHRLTSDMLAFMDKHQARLTALGCDSEVSIADITGAIRALQESQEAEDRAMETYYQSTANLAESKAALLEKMFECYHAIHAKWDELDYLQRESFAESMESYMENREHYLASLPMEVRQSLEERFPKWW